VRAYRVRSGAARSRRTARSRRAIAVGTLVGLVALAGFASLRWDAVSGIASRGSGLALSAASVAPVRLAVLPLEDLSGDSDQTYFADGMHDVLITDLAGIDALRVTARASALRYGGTDKTVAEIATELGVDAVVTGSVLRSGDRMRITAQLVDGTTEEHLWAERYDRPVREVLTLQNEIVAAIVSAVQSRLTPEEERQLARARSVDPEAHEAYLRGMYFLNQATPEGIERGLALLHDAVDRDPSHALPYAHLAAGYATLGHGPSPPPDTFERARAAAATALELDDNVALAHAVSAELILYAERTWDWPAAERAFRRAIELNPTLARAHAHYAYYLVLFDRWEEALASMRRAQEADPLTPLWAAWQAGLYVQLGRHEEATRELRKSLELNPDFPVSLQVLGYQHAYAGEREQAMAAAEKAAELAPPLIVDLATIYALTGRGEDARRIAAEVERAGADPFGVAMTYAALGDAEGMFRALETGYEKRSAFLPWMGSFYIQTRPYRGDPRFIEMLRLMNLGT
jgi:TolB-like protein/Flp pilus assembly protein TadD